MTCRNLHSLELPDYSNSTKSEVNLSTHLDYDFLSYPKVEALQWYVLSSHGLCWTWKHSVPMATHVSVGLKVTAVEIPEQK